MTEVTEFCEKHKACTEGRKFAVQFQTLAEVWSACNRPDWMLWMLRNAGIEVPDSTLRKFACRCVRETPLLDGRKVWDLLADKRSRRAVEVAELHADGKASHEELEAAFADAATAAYAAYAADAYAADAAYAAARARAARSAAYAARAAAADAADAAAAYAAYAADAYAARAAYAADADAAARAFQDDLMRSMIPNPFSKE